MGYEMGVGEARYYVGDDGKVYSYNGNTVMWNSVEEMLEKETPADDPSELIDKMEDVVEKLLEGDEGPDGDPFICDICGEITKTERGMRAHVLYKHKPVKKKAKKKGKK